MVAVDRILSPIGRLFYLREGDAVNFEERTEQRLNDHGERIRMLEIGNATQNERLDALCKKLDGLAESITDLMDLLKTCLWKALGVGGTFLWCSWDSLFGMCRDCKGNERRQKCFIQLKFRKSSPRRAYPGISRW